MTVLVSARTRAPTMASFVTVSQVETRAFQSDMKTRVYAQTSSGERGRIARNPNRARWTWQRRCCHVRMELLKNYLKTNTYNNFAKQVPITSVRRRRAFSR